MQQPKARKSPPLTPTTFRSILRSVHNSGGASLTKIGEKHGVSRETVASVRRAGTWPQFVKNKKAARAKQVAAIAAKTLSKRGVGVVKTKVKVQPGQAVHANDVVRPTTVYVALSVEEHDALMALAQTAKEVVGTLDVQSAQIRRVSSKLDTLLTRSDLQRRRGLFGRR